MDDEKQNISEGKSSYSKIENKSERRERDDSISKVCNELIAPLDFSFMQLKTLQDLKGLEPRVYKNSPRPKKINAKYESGGMKLNNNSIDEVSSLDSVMRSLIRGGNSITWLDLSCNLLTDISKEILKFSYLKILHLHGNKITELVEVDKLGELPSLVKLTLHGNPIELEKKYFFYVLSRVPGLTHLDFTGVSPGDRMTASTLENMMFKNRNRKQRKKD